MDCRCSTVQNITFGRFWRGFSVILKLIEFYKPFNISYLEKILDYPQIRPFVIAIWCGEGKPILNEYLARFVEECVSLSQSDIIINNHKLRIYIKALICDTPARAYIKGFNFKFIHQKNSIQQIIYLM